jgi:GT2 family glycosyltransferase
MRLLIVIVNYRSASLTIDCLRSLAPEIGSVGGGARVVVTDNASGDDSLDKLARAIGENNWSAWVTLQPLERNGGFAYGNNQAIGPALAGAHPPDYVLLLNPDTLVRPGAIESLVRFMDEHPQAGIAGSRLEHPDGTPQQSAFRFHSVLSELEGGVRIGPVSKLLKSRIVAMPVPAAACRVDWVAGASMIVRRAVFASAGLMDEAYFMYFEEVDFCLKANRRGWPCWYVPESRVVHLVGQTSGVTDRKRANRRRPAYWFDSRRRYFLKNHGRVKTFLADLAWSGGFATFRARQFLQRKPDTEPARLLRDFVQHNFCAFSAGKGQV